MKLLALSILLISMVSCNSSDDSGNSGGSGTPNGQETVFSSRVLRVVPSKSVSTADFGTASNMQELQDMMDDACNETPYIQNSVTNPSGEEFKAMVYIPGQRVACTSPNCVSGGLSENMNWVLKPSTTYYVVTVDAGNSIYSGGDFPLFTTNANGIFDFSLGNMDNPVVGFQDIVIESSTIQGTSFHATGFNDDWTGNTTGICSNWSSTSGFVDAGNNTDQDSGFLVTSTPNGTPTCLGVFSILCAQQ